ncbi:MAG: DUF1845 domain-containing protein, partial [Desulfobacterales bacterium]|nr:DUF1845 domain-containing protein [Desulfobacterales bacterium]
MSKKKATRKIGKATKKTVAVADETAIKEAGAESVPEKDGTPRIAEGEPPAAVPKIEDGAAISAGAVIPDGIDPNRPYIFGADKKPIQMSPMDEKVFREDYGETESDATMAIFEELEQEARKIKTKVERSQVDPGVTDRMRKAVPKAGMTVARIEIHMRQVFNNVIGRRNVEGRPNIVGLYLFSSAVNRMVGAYRGNGKPCPFAAWYLWRIEQEIHQLRQTADEYDKRVDELIEEANVGIVYEPYTSSAPAVETLSFHSIHGFQVASVLHRYDSLLRRIWPYVRNRFVSTDDFVKL